MVGLVAGLVGVGAVAVGAGVTKIVEASGFLTVPRTEGWIEAHLFFSQAAAFLEESLLLFNADFFGRSLSIESALAFATAIGVIVALVAPFIVLRRRLDAARPADTPSRTRQVGVHLLLGGDDGHRPARRHRE